MNEYLASVWAIVETWGMRLCEAFDTVRNSGGDLRLVAKGICLGVYFLGGALFLGWLLILGASILREKSVIAAFVFFGAFLLGFLL